MILTAWSYAWSVLSACVVVGIVVCLLDRKWGIHIYRFYYDVRHRKGAEMPKEVMKGFLYNQSTNRGVFVAGLLSTLYSLYMAVFEFGLHMNFVAELIIWFFMTPALVAGFWVGGLMWPFLLKRNKYFDDFDRISAQASELGVAGVKNKALDAASGLTTGLSQFFPKGKSADPKKVNGSAAESKDEPPPENPRDTLRRFEG